MTTEEKIVQYYDACEMDYRLVWSLSSALAIHYGYWDEDTKSHVQSLLNQNRMIAKKADISAQDMVLDAGCGVGGTSIYLAKNIGCRVVGITLSDRQVHSARENARRAGVSHLVDFYQKNYVATDFPEGAFDVVIASESLCQASEKNMFFHEAKRILKKGGRIVVADFFTTRDTYNVHEAYMFDQWSRGWGFMHFVTHETLENTMREAGFVDVRSTDETAHIIPSARRLYNLYVATAPLGWITERLGIRKPIHALNRLTAYWQYQTLRRNLWKYYIVTGCVV